MAKDQDISARGRRVAVFMAAVGLFWILAFQLGIQYNWSLRVRALFDLIAFAGFAYGLWLGFNLWRESRGTED